MPQRGYVGPKRIGSKTNCGISPRAKVVGRDGNKLTYEFPCGYRQTELLMHGYGRLRKPADLWTIKFFERYWKDGVIYQCPRCLRQERKAARS